MEVDGKTRRCYAYHVKLAVAVLTIAAGAVLAVAMTTVAIG